MHIASIGIDLGKTTFHLVGLGERSKVLVRKKFSRAQLLAYTANLPSSLIGLEACAGAHFLGAALRGQGHSDSFRASSSSPTASPTRTTSLMAKRSLKP